MTHARPLIRLAAGLSIDANEYASRANAILGIRDSGKTYTATLIAEELFAAAIPFITFDPIGRWQFLRRPGRGPGGQGYPVVVAGGVEPDFELTPANAADLVRAAMLTGTSMVLDLYSVELSKAQWRAIVRESISVLLYEGERFGLRHVFLEEAAEFIPQRIGKGHATTYAEVEKLARMGGNVGCGITIVNQRAEEVNKAVLELCDNLLLHRQRGKNSLLSLGKWLEAGNVRPPKEITDSIATLPTGECWAWLRELPAPVRVKVRQKRSMDPDRREARSSRYGQTAAAADVTDHVAAMRAALKGKPVVAGRDASFVVKDDPAPEPQEAQVDEKEAQALRAENDRLKEQVDDLQQEARKLRGQVDGLNKSPPPASRAGGDHVGGAAGMVDVDEIYRQIRERLLADEPKILAVLTAKPELEVTVTRHRIEASDDTVRGRIAVLISEGFFDEGNTGYAAHTELARRGRNSGKPNVYRECDALAALGFLTKEPGGGYKSVAGAKVRIIEK